jgi:hypothetical protein
MAIHFQHGHLTIFYWGATYAGTLEPFLTAIVFFAVGPSVIALKSVPIALAFVAALLVWRSSREYFGPGHGPLEGAIFWIYPAGNLLLLMKAQVVYASGSCFVVGLLLLSLRIRSHPRPRHSFLFGLLSGLSLWATPLALATIIPLALVTFRLRWRNRVMLLTAMVGAVVGASFWLWFTVRTGGATLRQIGTVSTSYWDRLQGGVLELYPLLLGLRRPVSADWVLGPLLGRVAYVALFIALLAVPLYRFGARVVPLVVPVVAFPFLYAVSTTSWYTAEPRHGMLIAPLMLMLAVSLVPRAALAQIACFVVLAVMTSSSLWSLRDLGERSPGMATVHPGKLAPVIETMERNGLHACYADYWIAYRITFETEEDIICAAYWGERYPGYRRFADLYGARTYLFIRDTASSDSFRERLRELRLPFTEQGFDTVQMFVLDEPRRPEEINQCVKVPWLAEPTCPSG